MLRIPAVVCLAAMLSVSTVSLGTDDLTPELEELVKRTGVPALACAVIVEGRIAAMGAYGLRKRGSPEKVTIEDKWHLGSCTKTWTATLASLLVADGTIAWDGKASDVLKGVKIHESLLDVTLLQLLSNTGGLPKDVPPRIWTAAWRAEGPPLRQRLAFVRAMLAEPSVFPPGEGYEYSNTGFAVAGTMLEKAAGKPFEQLMRDRIFKPLQLQGAGFHAPGSHGRIDQPYGHNADGPVAPKPAGDNPPAIAPAGGIHCRIEDWAKFALAHLGDDAGLLSEEQRLRLRTPVSREENYAMGWFVGRRPWSRGPVLNHLGSNTMWHAAAWLGPEEKFGVLVTTNDGTERGRAACDETAAAMLLRYRDANVSLRSPR